MQEDPHSGVLACGRESIVPTLREAKRIIWDSVFQTRQGFPKRFAKNTSSGREFHRQRRSGPIPSKSQTLMTMDGSAVDRIPHMGSICAIDSGKNREGVGAHLHHRLCFTFLVFHRESVDEGVHLEINCLIDKVQLPFDLRLETMMRHRHSKTWEQSSAMRVTSTRELRRES